MTDVARFIDLLRRQPPLLSLHHPSDEIAAFLETIEDRTALYKAAMLELMDRRQTERVVPEVSRLYEIDFARIKQAMETNPREFYEFPNDPFVKDLSLCCGRAFPARAQIVEISGIGRRVLLYGGMGRLAGTAAFFLRAGGFAPWYQIHTHTSTFADFNEDGWNECYRIVAGMLALHPEIKGLYGSSWFYDPALEEISPRLSYLRHVPLSGGAKLFYRGGDLAANVANATAKSETRRKLYEAGRYKPAAYVMAWRRAELLSWAARDGARGVS